MDRKTYTLGILTVTATILFAALLFAPPTPVNAQVAGASGVVARDRDYTLLTAPIEGGGDALYIMDNRRGNLVVFTYNNSAKSLTLRAAEPIANAFKGLGNAANPAAPAAR